MYSKILRRFVAYHPTFGNVSIVRNVSELASDDRVIGSPFPEVEIPNVTIPELIFQNWSSYSNRVALECAVTGKKYTFEEVRRKSDNLSASLRKRLKLQKGDVIAILLPNTPDYAVCVLGALQAGLIVTTLTPLYSVEEITRHLTDTDAKAIISIGALVPLVQKCSLDIPVISVKSSSTDSLPEKTISFQQLTENVDNDVFQQIDLDDVALLPTSSGTTGFPKAVQLTHRNIVANLCQMNQQRFNDVLGSTSGYQSVIPGILPFFHVAGLLPSMFTSLWNMGKLITLPNFHPELYIKTLENHKPNFLLVVPYIINFITNNAKVKKDYFDSVHIIASSTAPLSAVDEDKLINKVGNHIDLIQAYGLTETALISLSDSETTTGVKNVGSVGKPLQNTYIKVVDENGELLGPSQPGELCIKGPQVMKGYYKKPKETEETIADGWFKTGDVGFYNEDKMFFITDRIKELIKVKGFQVAPAELEAIIRENPHVLEACVIGVRNKVFGEVPKAIVVLKDKDSIKPEELMEFVAGKVANYKQLKGGVTFVDNLPKAASGKVVRKEVKAMYQNTAS